MSVGRFTRRGLASQGRAFAGRARANSGEAVVITTVATRRANLIGTSLQRASLYGTSRERGTLVGTSHKRATLEGEAQ